jgi:hypothetical protein
LKLKSHSKIMSCWCDLGGALMVARCFVGGGVNWSYLSACGFPLEKEDLYDKP